MWKLRVFVFMLLVDLFNDTLRLRGGGGDKQIKAEIIINSVANIRSMDLEDGGALLHQVR